MNRPDYILKRLSTKYSSGSDYNIINALINTLSPLDAIEFFYLTFQQDYHARRYVLKKIAKDISKSYIKHHGELISFLIKKLDEKGFNKKESCASSIDFLYDSLPIKEKETVLKLFLSSKSSRIRLRAYKRMYLTWQRKHQSKIEEIWHKYKDPYCLRIFLKHFPPEFLHKNYKDILQQADHFQILKLVQKLREVDIDIDIASELKAIDQISYVYVLTKLNKNLSEKEAREVLNNNYTNERIGLLIWCYGQMRLWDIIIEYDINQKGK